MLYVIQMNIIQLFFLIVLVLIVLDPRLLGGKWSCDGGITRPDDKDKRQRLGKKRSDHFGCKQKIRKENRFELQK